jgi:urease gamma subunit
LIRLKVKVAGEKDASPLYSSFEYSDESYNTIFLPSIKDIQGRLAKGLRINLFECLALYCYYVVSQLRKRNNIECIQEGAKRLLSQQSVLIGVPESVRNIYLSAKLNDEEERVITLEEPIKIPHYFLSLTSK